MDGFHILYVALCGFLAPALTAAADVYRVIKPAVDLAETVLVWGVLPTYALWILYLAVMNLKRAKKAGNLTGFTLWIGYPVLFLGYAFDLFVTLIPATVLFWDLPRELTLTARLKRYALTPGTRRFTMAILVAYHLLDRFDPDGWHVVNLVEASLDVAAAREAVLKAYGIKVIPA